jgi:hypothetical protein
MLVSAHFPRINHYCCTRSNVLEKGDDPLERGSSESRVEILGVAIPRVDFAHLCRCLVSSAMLTLLVSPGKDLEQLFSNSNRLAFVTDLLLSL